MIKFCKAENHYTMKEECHGEKTKNPHPPKFSIEDKYGKYRRIAKSKSLDR